MKVLCLQQTIIQIILVLNNYVDQLRFTSLDERVLILTAKQHLNSRRCVPI